MKMKNSGSGTPVCSFDFRFYFIRLQSGLSVVFIYYPDNTQKIWVLGGTPEEFKKHHLKLLGPIPEDF